MSEFSSTGEVVVDDDTWDRIMELLEILGNPAGLPVEDAGRAIVMARDLWEEISNG